MKTAGIVEEREKIIPEHMVYTDDDHTVFTAEIILNDVAKENIVLRMRDDSFYLTAPTEHTIYTMSHGICHPVDPSKAKAAFENGILRLDAPFKKPLKPLVEIRVE